MIYDVIIIGRGPAGLTAGIYASRFKMKNLIIGQDAGNLALAPIVENWPGFESVPGPQLLDTIKKQAIKYGSEIIEDQVTQVSKTDHFIVKTEKQTYEGQTLIVAMGTQHRKLNVPGEAQFQGKGVTYCATCDAPLYKDKIVAVVGGGDSAAKTALLLAKYAQKIYVLVRDKAMIAEPQNLENLKKQSKVEIKYGISLQEVKGDSSVKEIVTSQGPIKTEGVFVAIGQIPSDEALKNLDLKMDKGGYILVNDDFSTNIAGVFAAGDIATNESGKNFRQSIVAAGQGAMAANGAYTFLRTRK